MWVARRDKLPETATEQLETTDDQKAPDHEAD
jgi:hypothetical protein